MAGGFFSESGQTPKAADTPSQSTTPTTKTSESSPGGFFGTGTDVNATRNAAASDADARKWASYSKGWAVGSSTGSLSDFGDQNNSKYYSEQSQDSARDADASASAASSSATFANSSALSAASARDLALGYRNQAEEYRDEASGFASKTDSDADAAATSAAEAFAYDTDAQFQAAQALSRANAAMSSAATAMGYASSARSSASSADTDATAARDDRMLVQTILTQVQEAESRISDSEAYTAASAAAAATSATTARDWAVGPSGNGIGASDSNNAHYWAMVARAATNVEVVQFDFIVGGTTDGIRYTVSSSRLEILDTELWVEDPIISYNGVVLSDSEHYQRVSDHEIIFASSVSPVNGDCITVTGAGGGDQNNIMPVHSADPITPALGQFYFNSDSDQLRIYNGTSWRRISTA